MGEMGVWVEKSNKKKETLRVHLSVRLERYAVCMLTCGERSESDEQMSRWKKEPNGDMATHGKCAIWGESGEGERNTQNMIWVI